MITLTNINLHASFPFICGILMVILGVFILSKNFRSKVHLSYFLLCFVTSVWMLFYALGYFVNRLNTLEVYLFKIGYSGVIFIPIMWIQFIIYFLDLRKEKKTLPIFHIIGFIFLFLLWKTNYFMVGLEKYFWGYYPKASLISHPLFLLFYSFLWILAVFYLWKTYKNEKSPIKRNHIKYVFFSLFVVIFGLGDFLPNYGIKFYPLAPMWAVFSIAFFTYGIFHHHLLDIKIAIARTTIFLIIYTLILGIPFVLGYITKSWLISSFLMFTLASFGPVLYSKVKKQVEDNIRKEDIKKYETLKKFSKSLVLILDLDKLVKLITYRVVKTLRISYGAIYILNREGNTYDLKFIYSLKRPKPKLPDTIPEDNYIIKQLTENKKYILYEDTIKIQNNNPSYLQLNTSLILPSFVENELIGFLALGEKLNLKSYTEVDLDILNTLSSSASLAILNALYIIELRKTEQELAESQRIAQLGYLASSIGHQLGNLLQNIAAISGALLFNRKIIDTLKDRQDVLDLFKQHIEDILKNVEEGGSIMSEIRAYAQKEDDKEFELIDLREVVQKALKILYIPANKFQTIDIIVNVAEDVPLIKGSFVQLQHVFINLLNNAYDAIQQLKIYIKENPQLEMKDYKGKIEISIIRDKSKVIIHVIDDGIGIPKEAQRRLFVPMYTTKTSSQKRKEQNLVGGTGIGLYTILIIIRNHKGTIRLYNTEYLKGSDFLIELPIPKES